MRMRRWLIMQFLMTYYHNFVRHLIEGELQRRIYVLAEKGQPITASILSKVQGEILEEFWAGEVEIDEGARLTWMRQPHYYMGLYPYSYSAGLTIGTAVSKAIREEGAPAVERWLNVLKAGGTKGPIELAKMAGVDMNKQEPIHAAVEYSGLVDEVLRLLAAPRFALDDSARRFARAIKPPRAVTAVCHSDSLDSPAVRPQRISGACCAAR